MLKTWIYILIMFAVTYLVRVIPLLVFRKPIENKFIRSFLKIKKKQYFKRTERVSLKEFLEKNTERCCVCVYGHFIYVDGNDYWSFFDNDNDKIVCIWYIESGLHEVVH